MCSLTKPSTNHLLENKKTEEHSFVLFCFPYSDETVWSNFLTTPLLNFLTLRLRETVFPLSTDSVGEKGQSTAYLLLICSLF